MKDIVVRQGDSRSVLQEFPPDHFDSCVTDPPYALVSIVKRFGQTAIADETQTAERSRNGADGYARLAKGFMGKAWDNGATAFDPAFWAEVLRVLKPGAHLLAFGGTRTYHRLTCAIEDGGFEIRDAVLWHYSSGFPKSHDVSKGIDRAAGLLTARGKGFNVAGIGRSNGGDKLRSDHPEYEPYRPSTPYAENWTGWGTALKPATEIICMARKPLSEGTVAANVLRWGTGALNIDACRIAFASDADKAAAAAAAQRLCHDEPSQVMKNLGKTGFTKPRESIGPYLAKMDKGRWPANVIHDGSDEMLAAFPDSDGQQGRVTGTEPSTKTRQVLALDKERTPFEARCDSGSAARFFYSAKADADDRLGSKHPTVKPIDLLQYLIRLVTRRGGMVLDPFAGTGTTGEAAFREGCGAMLIEREDEYVADINRRIALLLAGPDERQREAVKAAGRVADAGPLFP